MPSAVDDVRTDALTRGLRALARGLLTMPQPVAVLFALAWALLIWFLSAQKPVVFGVTTPWHGVLTNAAHAPEYAVLTAFLVLALPRRNGWPVLTRAHVALVLGVVLAYAITDEVHQSFVPDRDGSLCDVVTDLVGAIVLLVLVQRLSPDRPRPVWKAIGVGALGCLVAALLASFASVIAPSIRWL